MRFKGELFEEEGVQILDGPSSAELNNLPPIQRVQTAERLSALESDFVFFNHGMLFTEAGLKQDPVEEFLLKKDKYDAVFAVEYSRPLFKGLNFKHDNSWNKILLGCKREFWPELYFILNGLIAACPIQSKIYSCFMQNVYLPDPNVWDGVTLDSKVNPNTWGTLCENADRGLHGDERYKNVIFPSSPPPIKIFISGVSGPIRLSYFKSGLFPYVAYDAPEPTTLVMQGALKNNVI